VCGFVTRIVLTLGSRRRIIAADGFVATQLIADSLSRRLALRVLALLIYPIREPVGRDEHRKQLIAYQQLVRGSLPKATSHEPERAQVAQGARHGREAQLGPRGDLSLRALA
jgi:hypothetical protein